MPYVVRFRVRVYINDIDGDWEMICYDGLMITLIAMKMETVMALRIIAGWGVVPRMAPPPSQGGST